MTMALDGAQSRPCRSAFGRLDCISAAVFARSGGLVRQDWGQVPRAPTLDPMVAAFVKIADCNVTPRGR